MLPSLEEIVYFTVIRGFFLFIEESNSAVETSDPALTSADV